MDHWPTFTEFVKQELATGGPDPQVQLIAELCKGHPVRERVWLAGCYAAHHCVPSAYMVWLHWRPEKVYADCGSLADLEKWLREHWAGLPVRAEMRSHRMPEKRAQCLQDFAKFALVWEDRRFADFDNLWDVSIAEVKYFGRYMAIKYLEMLRLVADTGFEMPDMRAQGGWSPRRTLGMLWPEEAILSQKGNQSIAAIGATELALLKTQTLLREAGVTVSKFQLQVLLCEYREALNAGYYPGASHDEEMTFINIVEEHFGFEMVRPIYEARKRLFPVQVLGEHGNPPWSGVRPEKFLPFKVEGRH